jgi:hypothetical protein
MMRLMEAVGIGKLVLPAVAFCIGACHDGVRNGSAWQSRCGLTLPIGELFDPRLSM